MAVCGRCWLCGTKFSCTLTDVGAVVVKPGEDTPTDLTEEGRRLCTSCVDAIDGNLTVDEPNEPHGDGVAPSDRLGHIVALLTDVVLARRQR